MLQDRPPRSVWPQWLLHSQSLTWSQVSVRLWASEHPSVATGATDVNCEPGCSRVMDPDMAPGSSPGPYITIVLDGSTGLLDQHGPMVLSDNKCLLDQHGPCRTYSLGTNTSGSAQTLGILRAFSVRSRNIISTEQTLPPLHPHPLPPWLH